MTDNHPLFLRTQIGDYVRRTHVSSLGCDTIHRVWLWDMTHENFIIEGNYSSEEKCRERLQYLVNNWKERSHYEYH
jgi:hypothetical protein